MNFFLSQTSDGVPSAICELPIDPATISTAQQKLIHFRTRRIFSNPKVASGMKVIQLLASPIASKIRQVVPRGTPIALSLAFCYAYPKGTPKKNRIDLAPMPNGADCDNRAKAPIDALTKAGWWEDDRCITALHIYKRRTIDNPRIIIAVYRDNGVNYAPKTSI